MIFQDDVLRRVLGYLPKHYLFIAPVCSQWYRLYRAVNGEETVTSFNALASSLSTVLLHYEETRYFRFHRELGIRGAIQMVQWLRARNRMIRWRYDPLLVFGTAQGGHLDLLKWLIANDCPVDRQICYYAAKEGHLEMMKYAKAIELDGWEREFTCESAARGGHLEVLQWLRSFDSPWDWHTCAYAAKEGHLEVLKWARARGCPCGELTCLFAAVGGHLKVLRWARANGCPWFLEHCLNAVRREGHEHVVQWIESVRDDEEEE